MKPWIKIAIWTLFFGGLIFLGLSISDRLNNRIVPSPEITIHIVDEHAFLTEQELYKRLKRNRLIFDGQTVEQLDIEKIEAFVKSISQVKNVDVFQSVDGSWKIDVSLRKPIARIFNNHGETFYLDNEGNPMLVTPSYTARVLVVSGKIEDRKTSVSVEEIINNDSLISIRKLDDIYRISNYVCNDPLLHSLLGQLYLEENGDFVLTPIVGDQKIVFGSAYSEDVVRDKFEKLKIFYKEAMPYEGWNSYTEISLKYDNQIVCKKKETNE